MSDAGMALAQAAHRLVGRPFRLQGRDPRAGLDCLGVVVAALRELGRDISAIPQDYGVRRIDLPGVDEGATRCGLTPVSDALRPGDLLLVQPGPATHHFMIAGPQGGFVHAHASLRRVVETPAPSPWPELRRWRLED